MMAAVLIATLVGHVSIFVWLFNRLHALGWPRPIVKTLEKGLILGGISSLIAGSACAALLGPSTPLQVYEIVSTLAALLAIPLWLVPKLREKTPAALLSNDTMMVDVEQRLGFRPIHGGEARLLAAVPGNELLRIAVQRKTIRLPQLPAELNGISIAHLSDLHMTGQLGREFYDVVVDETNALGADLVVLTGDILEREKCLPWIAPTLGRLQARAGKFFILGNHEQRLHDVAPLRDALTESGFTDLGGRVAAVSIRGIDVLIAGTERPWFGVAPDVPQSAIRNPQFRLLLSHTPDQLPWARKYHFDLMLAGHNHGGQIRFPLIGALITPSFYGSRYAGGLYHEPPTLLHVSRGLAGIHPIRLNCPPEIPLLTLKA